MDATTVRTRMVRPSTRKIGNVGRAYTDTFIGMRAVFTTFEGERMVGTVARFERLAWVIDFPGGKHARVDWMSALELVNGEDC